MMKKKTVENYLTRIPMRKEHLRWSTDRDGMVTLELENKGVFNRLAQKLFKKPPVSYIHLDAMGSFIWPMLGGEKDISAIGSDVKTQFGEKANPLYERLIHYFQILESYHFIKWKKEA